MSQKKYNVLILGNENPDENALWIKALEKHSNKTTFKVIDLSKNNWLELIRSENFDYLLAKPPGHTTRYKNLYDERVFILEKVLSYPIYPNSTEIFIYENKRFLSFWLNANNIPHPTTYVFYEKKDAFEFITKSVFPIVAKVNIGASGSGVNILKSKTEANKYIENVFSGKGAKQRVGPNFQKSGLLKRGLHYVTNPKDISKKLKIYKGIYNDKQSGFVLFQEFIKHEFEWRVVRIGDSFFAHKKLVSGEKASGSLLKGYDNPPLELLNFVKEITDKHFLFSQAVDIFESSKGYLVNEMQCIFGQSDSFQMMVDGKIGRYVYLNSNWIFEEGDFNSNECYDLRVDFILNKLAKL